jgi:acetyl esterase/lipase
MRRLLFLLLSLVVPSASAQPASSVPLPEGTKVLKDVAYVPGGHERQKLDLYLPPSGSQWPLVVAIHGGAFRAGSKESEPAGAFVARGLAVAAINYRLSQHAVFPAQIEDCKAAVRWLRANAPQHGYDPDRIASYGASAGGHLAAMLGTAGDVAAFDVGGHLRASSRVQAVVDFFGPTDFLQMDAHRPSDKAMVHDTPDSPESQLVGGPIRDNPEKVARANPVTYVTADDPPFLIVHGDADLLVPHHQSQLLETALRKAGVRARLVTVPGGPHGGETVERGLPLALDFLAEVLSPATR